MAESSKKIQIVYFINSLNIGGSEKVLLDSVNNMDSNKYGVTIISLSLFNPDKTILNLVEINPNIQVFYFNYHFFDDYSIFGYLKLFFKNKNSFSDIDKIIKVIKDVNPDIIHFHTTPRELLIKNFLNTKAKFVFTDHSLRINKKEYGFLKSKILALIYKKLYTDFSVITVSRGIEKSLNENKIISAGNKITTISNGVNIDLFDAANTRKKNNEFIVIYISRIELSKGHEDLINAWALLTDVKCKHLYLVGPDGLNGKIQALAKTLKCEDSITFTGPHSNPKELLSKSSIAVFPSYKEGLPLSLLEKMAMSLTVIVSDIDELTSIITNEENGIVFKLGNSIDLSEKIRFLYLNNIKADSIGKNARKTVELNYNFKVNIARLDQFYTAILN